MTIFEAVTAVCGNRGMEIPEGFDVSAAIAAAQAKYTWELWDRQAPINGAEASVVLQRKDIPETGSIYLVRVDGNVALFQPHVPSAEGIQSMTEEWAGFYAQEQVDGMVVDEVVEQISAAIEA